MHGNGSDERDDDHDKSYQPENIHIPESDLPKNVVFRLNKWYKWMTNSAQIR